MKIAISATTRNIESPIDPRFGRAQYFAIYDSDSKSYFFTDNTQNMNAAQGAGIQTAQNILNSKADCVITGHCGPKAYRVLNGANVKIYLCEDGCSVRDAVSKMLAGELKLSDGADVEGHWM